MESAASWQKPWHTHSASGSETQPARESPPPLLLFPRPLRITAQFVFSHLFFSFTQFAAQSLGSRKKNLRKKLLKDITIHKKMLTTVIAYNVVMLNRTSIWWLSALFMPLSCLCSYTVTVKKKKMKSHLRVQWKHQCFPKPRARRNEPECGFLSAFSSRMFWKNIHK